METPGPGYGLKSVPVAKREAPLPFLMKLIVCFLGVDALERLVLIVRTLLEPGPVSDLTGSEFEVGGVLGILAISISILLEGILILLLLLRTWWGRLWTQALVGIHFLYVANLILVTKPELLMFLDLPARIRVGATLVLDAVVLAYLWSREARQTLSR